MSDTERREGSVTVVVMTRDRCDNLLHTLDRLRDLPERPPVVVVDNDSSDGTVAEVARRHPWVAVRALPENLGAVARTVGATTATTAYIAFADDDSWWEPGALRRAAELLDANPRLGLLAARILVGPDAHLDPVCAEMAASPLPAPPGGPGPSVLGFVACGAVVRREAFLEVGGFSPVIFFFGEETVLAQDLSAAGWDLCYVPDVVARHEPGGVAGRRSDRRRLAVRNAALSLWLRRPAAVAMARSASLLARQPGCQGALGLLDAARRARSVRAARSVLPAHVERRVRLLESTASR